MAKTKSSTHKGDTAVSDKKSKSADKPVASAVKEGRVTKPAQSSKAKSKDMAKSTVDKVQKKDKKTKKVKEPTPEPESESEATSSSSSSSESESEDKAPVKKAEIPKANGAAKATAADKTSTSESESDSDSDGGAAVLKKDETSDGSEDGTSDSESEESVPAKLNGLPKTAEDDVVSLPVFDPPLPILRIFT